MSSFKTPNHLFLRNHDFLILSGLAAVFLSVDVAFAVVQGHLMEFNQMTVAGAEGFSIGTLLAQVVILALWAGLRPGVTVARTSFALLMLVSGAIAIQSFVMRFAPQLTDLRMIWGASYFGWMFLVVVFSAVQLSVLFIRRWTGYCLGLRSSQTTAETAGQFSLTELLTLPLLLWAPMAVLTAVLDVMNGTFAFIVVAMLVVMCLFYAGFHLWAVLRPSPSLLALVFLLLAGPFVLLPVSLFFTGRLNGVIFGIPFFFILCCTHFGALAIGLPTAIVARVIGYRFCSTEQLSTLTG